MMKILGLLKSLFVWLPGLALLSRLGGLGLSFAIPGAGAVMSAASAIGGWLWRNLWLGFRETFSNKHVWLVITLVAVGAFGYGHHRGYASGEGDLVTYRASAEALEKAANKEAQSVNVVAEAARAAERRKIALENEAERRAVRSASPMPTTPTATGKNCPPARVERVVVRVPGRCAVKASIDEDSGAMVPR